MIAPDQAMAPGFSPPRILRGITSAGARAAAVGTRPLRSVLGAVTEAGIDLERQAVDRLLDNGDVERLLDSPRLEAVVSRVLESDGAARLVDAFFDSGLFDHLAERLLASDGLWAIVDRVASSPAVAAAVSQQGLGFADELGGQLRRRSRSADDWVERAAHRLVHRRSGSSPPASDVDTP